MPKTSDIDAQLKAKRAELHVLDDLIAERKRYYDIQEALISELVESGNTQLMGLTHEIALEQQELRNLKIDKRLLIQDKIMLSHDLVIIREDIGNATTGMAFMLT
jgi:arginine deiminase